MFRERKTGLILSLDQHEDSVYSVAWSAHSFLVFASIGYNGQVLVHHVPEDEKQKILLTAA